MAKDGIELTDMLSPEHAEAQARLFAVHNRPLPSFLKWLESRDDGERGEGFKEFADLAARTQEQSLDHLEPHQASFGRMWMGGCIAAVELCNIEALKHNRPAGEIIATLPRVFAACCMYAMASVTKENTPYRDIAKIMSEEFRAAAKVAADALEAQR